MPVTQIRFNPESTNVARKVARLSALAVFALSSVVAGTSAMAAGHMADGDANARYQAERAVCNSGQSNQDKATCLKEAGAALAESKRGTLNRGPGGFDQNAMVRCNALPTDERDACQRRIQGEGTTSGSAATGGIIREIVTPDKK